MKSAAHELPVDLVAGARPNFVKIAALAHGFRLADAPFTLRIVNTGQHADPALSDAFIESLGAPAPAVNLRVGAASHATQTAAIMTGYEQWLKTAPRPRGVVVVGDVNSTLACAVTAAKLGIPVAHVEAGLRSFDRSMPEEINRVVTDAIADVLFVSEPSGERNLVIEGQDPARIHYVGNVMIDTLQRELPKARRPARDEPYAYVTLHRPSNVDDPARLSSLVLALVGVAEQLRVVLALHPRTRARLDQDDWSRLGAAARIDVLGPQPYHDNLGFVLNSAVVITDSGGLQEETTALGIPCLTLRPNTERPVTLSHGTNRLFTEPPEALASVALAASRRRGLEPKSIPGWDGQAGTRVADVLTRVWAAPGG